jgi:hypothetical protein
MICPLLLAAQQSGGEIEAHWKNFSQRSCVGATEIHFASLLVQGKIVLSNRGKFAVLLWRGPHRRGEMKVKSTGREASQDNAEIVFHLPFVLPRPDATEPKAAPDGEFVLLAPGQSFEESFQFGIPYPTVGNEDRTFKPRNGSYEASVQVLLSNGGPNPPRRAFKGMKAASAAVWTVGIPIVIDESAALEDCSLKPLK